MLKQAKNFIENSSRDFLKGLNTFEKLILTYLRMLSEFRYVLYSICFYLTMNLCIANAGISYFGMFFVLVSFFQMAITRMITNPKLNLAIKSFLNLLILIATIITCVKVLDVVIYILKNYKLIIHCARTIIFDTSSKWRQAFNLLRICIIPISTFATVYYKIKNYINLPPYKQIPHRHNILDGSAISVDISRENLKLPLLQIFSLGLNLIWTQNPLSGLITLIDILTIMVEYKGHKKGAFYFPLMLTSAINIFMGLYNLCGLTKSHVNIYANIFNK